VNFRPLDAERLANGNTLISDLISGDVIEINQAGKYVKNIHGVRCYSVEKLTNGNTLIADNGAAKVFELNKFGSEIWRYSKDLFQPSDAKRLPNGNTLIVDSWKKRLIEVNQTGGIVWEYSKKVYTTDVEPLSNNHTLIALDENGDIIEVDDSSEIVDFKAGLISVNAKRVDNGNTIVMNYYGVREFNRSGYVIWQNYSFAYVRNFERLKNGNSLISCPEGIYEFDKNGTLIWHKKGSGARKAERLPNGATLIFDGRRINEINNSINIDLGKTIWAGNDSYKISDFELLSNGNILLANQSNYPNVDIIEINSSTGQWVWNYSFPYYSYITDIDRLPNGNTIIVGYDQVIEINSTKNIVWNFNINSIASNVERLPNGNTLIIGDFSKDYKRRIIEVNTSGNIIWSYSNNLSFNTNAQRLASGNTLIADHNNNRVIEISSSKEIIWTYNVTKPHFAERLENGNTLIAYQNSLIEVNISGEIVLYKTGIYPIDAGRFKNGNTLIVDYFSRVLVMDNIGNIVWEKQYASIDADILDNGNTLITDWYGKRIIEIDEKGNVTWEMKSLNMPEDVERLKNGNIIVIESNRIYEADPNGYIFWEKKKVVPPLLNGSLRIEEIGFENPKLGYGIILLSSSENVISGNSFSNNDHGLLISNSSNNKIVENAFSKNIWAISIINSKSNTFENNLLKDNYLTLDVEYSSYNNFYNNSITNTWEAIKFIFSSNNQLNNTTIYNSWEGIKIIGSNNNSLFNNSFNDLCYGIQYTDSFNNELIGSKFIDNTNAIGLTKSSNNIFYENLITNNNRGIYLYSSRNNKFVNSSIISNTDFDFYLKNVHGVNTVLNSTLAKVDIFDDHSSLTINNYLHIQVNDLTGNPIQNADVILTDNNNITYATSGFNGSYAKTNAFGEIKWIVVTDRIYNRSGIVENSTIAFAKYNDEPFRNINDGFIDMSTSHYEYFYPNSWPSRIKLSTPSNNSYVRVSTPPLFWEKGSDINNDILTYTIQIDEAGGNWTTPIEEINNLKFLGVQFKSILIDNKSYQWRVRADDGFDYGPWSDIWKFTVDNENPIPFKPDGNCKYNKTGTIKWTWPKSVDTGSGILGYYVYIGTIQGGKDFIVDEWTTNNWYIITNVSHGISYYCRIKTKNGAGTISDFSPRSEVIKVDMRQPEAEKPLAPSFYNNSGTVRWTWDASDDTGSGIVGYYVYIGIKPGGNSIRNGVFTENTYFEQTGLEDGKTYYCRIKAINGVDTKSDFSPSSTGIYIDLDIPFATKPNAPIKYNYLGTIFWNWKNSTDTGSGILGYYVSVFYITNSTENYIVKDHWTNKTSFIKADFPEGRVYYCKIQAKNGAGTIGNYSENSSGVFIDFTAPSGPENLKVAPGSWTAKNLFTVSWAKHNDFSGIKGIFYKLGNPPESNYDGNYIQYDNSNFIENISVSGEGAHTIYIWFQDNAGI
jgi:parallel beta-helix repeat protein